GLFARQGVRVHDFPVRAYIRPSRAHRERLRADVLDVVQPVVTVRFAAEYVVVADLNGSSTSGLLLQLRHSARLQVVHDLGNVHGDNRPGMAVADLVDGPSATPSLSGRRRPLAYRPSVSQPAGVFGSRSGPLDRGSARHRQASARIGSAEATRPRAGRSREGWSHTRALAS